MNSIGFTSPWKGKKTMVGKSTFKTVVSKYSNLHSIKDWSHSSQLRKQLNCQLIKGGGCHIRTGVRNSANSVIVKPRVESQSSNDD